VLHAQGKIRSRDVWVTEPQLWKVPVLPLQLPWLERHQPSLENIISLGAFIGLLLVSFFLVDNM
jgi:hypothetical protein